MANQNTQYISISSIVPHPQNPRIAIREDVVAAILANLAEGFDPAHALIVRPVADCFEILSGHHRFEAAKRAGLSEVPCWVRDMDDEAAYMALVTSNSQGELSPLEIGMHALHCVALGTGAGRGQKGGLSAYAEKVGKSKGKISEYRQAAAVAEKCSHMGTLLDKAAHLSAIHSLPRECWQPAVEAMLAGAWSAKETSERVRASEAATEKRTIALLTNKTTRRELDRIKEISDRVAAFLNYDDLRDEWLAWLAEVDPVDVKEVQQKRTELEQEDFDRRESEKEPEQIITKPQLVLADPPWRYDFAQSDSRQIENQYPSASVDEIICHKPDTEQDCVLFLWATVAKLPEAFEIIEGWGFEYKTHAVWDKQKIGMGYWFRGQHELLIVATKGKVSPPPESQRVSSLFSEARGKHSAKPECVYSWIEAAFPNFVKLEMYCRNPRPNWLVMGNESNA
jgi:N6-adenosine-specific RNA methylase IME4/ParB-like chromosome segregation protein Spo0J